MQKIEMTVQEIMTHLEIRGGMYICPFNYDTLIAYIFGYEGCCTAKKEENPFDGLHELTHCRLGKQTNLVWPAVIRKLLAKDDEEAIKLFFRFFWDLESIRNIKGTQWLKTEFDRLEGLNKKRPTDLDWPKSIKHNKSSQTTSAKRPLFQNDLNQINHQPSRKPT